jgi:hypothetical protein
MLGVPGSKRDVLEVWAGGCGTVQTRVVLMFDVIYSKHSLISFIGYFRRRACRISRNTFDNVGYLLLYFHAKKF